MTGLTEFVDKYKVFMKWLDGKNKDPNEYVRKFEKIFSVTTETELLREIQDMKDELNMLSAVFRDQTSVLEKVGENIRASRTALLSKAGGYSSTSPISVLEKVGENIGTNSTELLSKAGENLGSSPEAQSVESSLSAFCFQQQSDKHAGHIKRMQDQANQAYDNVSVFSMKRTIVLTHSLNSFEIF